MSSTLKQPHHRRNNTNNAAPLSIAMDQGPTSTTKALLIVVVAPRKFYSRPSQDENQETETVTIETSATTKSTITTVKKDSSLEKDMSNDESIKNVTSEEAAAVVPTDEDPEEQEVNVEELLRIAFQTLLEEWHLLSVPTWSQILDKQSIATKISLSTLFSNQSVRIREVTSWIRMDVMARPASLGIILERLERIGVGSEVGTVCIYKAELCKTASPYAHLPQQNDSEYGDSDDDTVSSQDKENTLTLEEEEQERLKQERLIAEAKMEWKNAATRLRIEQVREQIVEQAAFSFDFIALLTIASILAGIGLITDNTVVIVASMLVSPIMGP